MVVFIFHIVCVQFIQMKNKKCIDKNKHECDSKTTFIILSAQKSNKRGYKNIPLTILNNNETLIDRQINTILRCNKNSDIILVSGFEHDRIVDYVHSNQYNSVRIAENQHYKMSSILESWRLGLNLALNQDTYIIHGDRIFNESCLSSKANGETHTLVHDINKNNYNLGILYEENKLINMSYGLPSVWSEIFFISKKDFNITRTLINEYKKRKIYTIESFINTLCHEIPISILHKSVDDVKTLKEI